MSDLRELYQDVILDHNKRPRNFGKLVSANRKADGFNPLCGDKVSVYLEMENGKVKDVRFEGSGCAISTASASLMTESVKGKSQEEADAIFKSFHELVTGHGHGESLGKLEVFSGVSEFPARVKCASLAWHTFQAALKDQGEMVTTE